MKPGVAGLTPSSLSFFFFFFKLVAVVVFENIASPLRKVCAHRECILWEGKKS